MNTKEIKTSIAYSHKNVDELNIFKNGAKFAIKHSLFSITTQGKLNKIIYFTFCPPYNHYIRMFGSATLKQTITLLIQEY